VTILLLVLLGAALALAERLVALRWYGAWFAQGMNGDAAVHYTIIRALKENWRTRWIDQYLISFEPMSYPTAFHRYAGLFSLAALRRRPWLPNLVLAVVVLPAFLVYVQHLVPVAGTARDHFLVVAGVVFAFATANLVFHGPAIAYLGLSERYLGRVACAATFVFILGGHGFGDAASWWLAVAAGTVAVLSSVFARQALLFSSPVLSLVWLDAGPVLVVLASFALALFIAPRHLTASMRHTVRQWRLYATHTKRGRLQRGVLSYYVRPRWLWQHRHQPVDVAEELVRREPTRSILAYPELTLVAVLLVVTAVSGHVGRLVLGPLIASGAVYAATSTDWLNHLGESYRYLEYELYFTVPVIVAIQAQWVSWGWDLVLLGCYLVAVAGAMVLWIRVVPRYSRPVHPDELSAFMDDVDKPVGSVVYPIPMLMAPDICARYETCQSFWWQPGMMTVKIYDEFMEEFPFLKRDFWPLFDKYGVTLVVCDKSQLHHIDWSYDMSGLVHVKENDRFAAYRVPCHDAA